MDPPYQGVVDTHNHRYRHGISFDEFVSALDGLRRKDIAFIVSYDGRTGTKRHGRTLPASRRSTNAPATPCGSMR